MALRATTNLLPFLGILIFQNQSKICISVEDRYIQEAAFPCAYYLQKLFPIKSQTILLMLKTLSKHKVVIAIGIIWLFHLSAIIGIVLGELEWFIQKTPLNLLISLLLFLLIYPINNGIKLIALIIFFCGGMFVEWLGVNYGILFGDYSYGNNLGLKLDGVPYLIGIYWALLTFISASILDYTKLKSIPKIILAAGLMVMLDYFMEHNAPIFDFWVFEGGIAPLENYITWFLVAILFQIVLRLLKIKGNKLFSAHLYLAQLVFFVFFFF